MVWTCRALPLVIVLVGCVRAHDVDAPDHPPDRPPGDFFGLLGPDCVAMAEAELDGLPRNLSCAGLFKDVEEKELVAGVREFTPAVPLWSDGSSKTRWIYLPPGQRIDNSDQNNWTFPVGTKFFKEFRVDGKRIETRLYLKTRDDKWQRTTYEWNDDETEATRAPGSGKERTAVQIGEGKHYRIPGGTECDLCHDGREDSVLGFEMISLGQDGAEGVKLKDLIKENLLTEEPVRDEIEVGDDGTGHASEALAWLHINCGVSCHNDNQNSEAYDTGLRFKLRPEQLDGRSSKNFDGIRTTVGVPAFTPRWNGAVRIVPGNPEASLVYQLISVRKVGKNDQMPPIATRIVPQEQVDLIAEWIRSMDPAQVGSGGGPD